MSGAKKISCGRLAPLAIPRLSFDDVRRFWAKVKKGGDDECWNWTGGTGAGYGRFKVKGRLYSSHRIVAHIASPNEDITFDTCVVMHSCDNRLCCNPAHISIGTLRENALDMIAKGRANWQNRSSDAGEVICGNSSGDTGDS